MGFEVEKNWLFRESGRDLLAFAVREPNSGPSCQPAVTHAAADWAKSHRLSSLSSDWTAAVFRDLNKHER